MERIKIKPSKTGKRLRTFSNIIMVIGFAISIFMFIHGIFESEEIMIYSIGMLFLSFTISYIFRGFSELVHHSSVQLEIKKFESRQLGYVYVEED